jgi:hypothetical protein
MRFTFKNFYATCTETNTKHARFKRRNSLRNRSTIYGKIHTHLRCFGSHFMQKSARARPRMIGQARFLRRNFWATFVVMKQIYDLR